MNRDVHSQQDFERSLLRSAKSDVPPKNGRTELAAKLGLQAATAVAAAAVTQAAATSLAQTAPIAKATSAKAATLALLKKLLAAFATTGFVLGVVTTSLVSLGLYKWHADTVHAPTTSVRAAPTVESAQVEVPPPAPTSERPVEVTNAPAPPKKAAVAPSAVASADKKPTAGALLAEEVRLLQTARTLAREGNTLGARAALEKYETEVPNGSMREEALALAIDVADAEHKNEEVRLLGAKFVATYPDSPHIERVRAAMLRSRAAP